MEPNPFENTNGDFSKDSTLQIVLILAMALRILENLYVIFIAFQSIIYLLKMKIEILKSQEKKFSKFNILIIFLLIFSLIIRPFAFTTIDSIIIVRLLSDISNDYTM